MKMNKNIQFPNNYDNGFSNKENMNSREEKNNFTITGAKNGIKNNTNLREFGIDLSNINVHKNSELSTLGFYKV